MNNSNHVEATPSARGVPAGEISYILKDSISYEDSRGFADSIEENQDEDLKVF